MSCASRRRILSSASLSSFLFIAAHLFASFAAGLSVIPCVRGLNTALPGAPPGRAPREGVVGRGIFELGEPRGEAYDAPWDLFSAGEPACESREEVFDACDARIGLRGVEEIAPKPEFARDAGRGADPNAVLRPEEAVGMLYLAGPRIIGFRALLGVGCAGGLVGAGGTTTQFLPNSSVLLEETCLRFAGRGGVDSRLARSI